MARCPSCGETLDIKSERCAACGWNKTERGSLTKGNKGISKNLVLYAAILFGVCLVVVVAVTIAKRPRKPAKAAVAAARGRAGSDSVPSPAAESAKKKEKAASTLTSGRGKFLAADYVRKVDDLLEKANRDRRRLVESKRITDKANSLLSEIEGKLRTIRSQAGTLENAPTDQSIRAVQKVLDDKLAEVRKMFTELP